VISQASFLSFQNKESGIEIIKQNVINWYRITGVDSDGLSQFADPLGPILTGAATLFPICKEE
jgi:hypothetical protein